MSESFIAPKSIGDGFMLSPGTSTVCIRGVTLLVRKVNESVAFRALDLAIPLNTSQRNANRYFYGKEYQDVQHVCEACFVLSLQGSCYRRLYHTYVTLHDVLHKISQSPLSSSSMPFVRDLLMWVACGAVIDEVHVAKPMAPWQWVRDVHEALSVVKTIDLHCADVDLPDPVDFDTLLPPFDFVP